MATRFSTFSRHFSRGLFFHVCIYMLPRARANVHAHFRARLCSVSVCLSVCVYPRPATPKRSPPATIPVDRSLFFSFYLPSSATTANTATPLGFFSVIFFILTIPSTRGGRLRRGTIYTFSGPSFLIGENFLLD